MILKLIVAGASLVALAALIGCAAPGMLPPTGVSTASGGTPQGVCNAQAAQSAVGKAADASVVEQARQSSGAQMARVLRPNQVVTLEFSEGRLNLDVNAGGLVTRVRCG